MSFELALLQAVSDWQRGGDSEQKRRRGEALKVAAASLDRKFRVCSLVIYRQISLQKGGVWELLADRDLSETRSGWTLSSEIAKKFKGGVPPEGWQGVILAIAPSPERVVVNLDALYREQAFVDAMEKYGSQIVGFSAGAGRYWGAQCEVVVDVDSVAPSDIYAMGGYSSDRDTLIRLMFGREPTPELIAWFDRYQEKAGVDLGPVWLEGDPWLRVLARMQPRIEELRAIKAAQLAASVEQRG